MVTLWKKCLLISSKMIESNEKILCIVTSDCHCGKHPALAIFDRLTTPLHVLVKDFNAPAPFPRSSALVIRLMPPAHQNSSVIDMVYYIGKGEIIL